MGRGLGLRENSLKELGFSLAELRVCQKKPGDARGTIVGGYWGLLGACKEDRLRIGASSLCSLRTTCMSSRGGNELGLISLTPEAGVGHCPHYY